MSQPIDIELLFVPGCPTLPETRALAEKVVAAGHYKAQIRETFVTDPMQAREIGFLGSPSVRVNGKDIEPEAATRTDFGTG